MKKTAVEIHQQLSASKKRAIVIKVIVMMVILLLGIPCLMIIATSYFTNRGIMMDAYLMSHEYTPAVSDYYLKNSTCPTSNDIKVTIDQTDASAQLIFTTDEKTKTCYIISRLKKWGTSTDDKLLVLGKVFTKKGIQNSEWQCYSNANKWFLPKGCNHSLPKTISLRISEAL